MEKEKANTSDKIRKKTKKILFISFGVCLTLVVFFSIIFAVYSIYYSDKILPNVRIGNENLGGKNQKEAHDFLTQKIQDNNSNAITLVYGEKKWTRSLDELNIQYDLSQIEKEAMLIGHHPNFLQTLKDQIRCLIYPYKIKAVIGSNSEDLRSFIAKVASEIDEPEKDASITYKNSKIEIFDGTTGKRLNQNQLFESILNDLYKLEKTDLKLSVETKSPNISADELKDAKIKVEQYLSQDFNMTFEKRKFTAIVDTLWSWITFTPKNNDIEIGFDQDKMKEWITEKIAKKIDSPVKEARLKMNGDKVVVFQQAQDGVVIDQERLVSDIIAALNQNSHEATINTKVSQAKDVDMSQISTISVSDLVGTATTNFVKSPNNRVHNITVGAGMFNGVLVRPGEEMSVVEVLGNVDASSGYLPELVIKEDGTKPEYGGGLCQVSTTIFRAAMNAGLTITERTNHRYRVSYYEPPVGMDATIYLPAPDLKIKNTYDGFLLIQAKVEDYNITFNIYGKIDGRKIKITDPTVYDVVSPPDPEYIETDTMCKGEMKKVESSHEGAKAKFEYYVYDAIGKEINKQVFNSTYVPWQAKYLVGTKEGEDCPPPEG